MTLALPLPRRTSQLFGVRLRCEQWCGLGFLAYATASLFWVEQINYWMLFHWVGLVLAFFIGYRLRSLRVLYISLCFFLSLNVAIALAQYFGWDYIPSPYFPAGLFGNANFLAGALALTIAAALAARLYWFLPVGGLGLWLTQSRGALIAVGVACLLFLWRRAKVTAFVVAVLTPILAFHFSTPDRINGLEARLGVWNTTFNHLSLRGAGLGSFQSAYDAFPIRINMTEARPAHAYNDYLEVVFEFGLGAILLLSLVVLALESAAEAERLVLVTFIALGVSHYPLFLPFTGLLAALAMGQALRPKQ